jgi:arginine/lysine/ornithine decarboxylase
MNQNKTPLLDAITDFIDTKPAYFRIPGHRLERGVSDRWTDKVGDKIFAYDVTETPMTDDLHSPESAIKEAQELLSELYKSDKSFFLVNGSTCGNEAMIISAALEGEKIMIARNAHKSAMMGLIISGAVPVYVMPEIINEWGIHGAVTSANVRRCFEENPDCKALFLVSPSYYGICSDLKAIADICHEYGALLLVDEAHGGHVYFDNRLPMGALEAGADMCVQSMHKVTGALTQSSVLHIKSHGIRMEAFDRVAQNLHLVQSTSPSYLLMTSLDCARYELAVNGDRMMAKAIELAEYARGKINSIGGFKCLEGSDTVDRTRLVISSKQLGITGFELDEFLFNQYQVNMELSDYENVLAIVTYANEKEDMDRLVEALIDIRGKYNKDNKNIGENNKEFPNIPPQFMTPRKAYFSNTSEIKWSNAKNKISAQLIAPYPPGIPVIYPGELITDEIWEYLEQFKKDNRHIHGLEGEYVKIIEH